MKKLLYILGCVMLAGYISIIIASDRPEANVYQKFRGDTCEWCGRKESKELQMNWAHAYPYNMSTNGMEYMRVAETNGATLCEPCHRCLNHFQNTSKYWNSELIPMVKRAAELRKEYK